MKLNKILFFTAFGVLFEKVFPLLISFVFINKIANEVYGLWIIYFQFFLIINSSIASPLILNFNNNFFSSSNGKINILETRIIILISLLGFLVLLFVPNTSILSVFLIIVMVFSSVFYLLISNYLRFLEQNLRYAKYSSIRFFLFACCLISFSYDNQLSVNEIVISFIVANSLPLIRFFRIFNISLYNRDFTKEFLKLSIYGVSTFFLSGIDRSVLGFYGYDLVSIATIGYAAAIANVPSILTEIMKKYFSPRFYRDFNSYGFYNRDTIKITLGFYIVLTLIQLLFPLILFFILKSAKLLKDSLVSKNFILLIFVFSIAMAIYNLYHFLNPIIFFKNKSQRLIYILFISSMIFLILLKLPFFNLDALLKVGLIKLFANVILVFFTLKLVTDESN